jgi:hypothetical protein
MISCNNDYNVQHWHLCEICFKTMEQRTWLELCYDRSTPPSVHLVPQADMNLKFRQAINATGLLYDARHDLQEGVDEYTKRVHAYALSRPNPRNDRDDVIIYYAPINSSSSTPVTPSDHHQSHLIHQSTITETMSEQTSVASCCVSGRTSISD